MRRLPLYLETEKSQIIERTKLVPQNTSCTLCPRGSGTLPSACLGPIARTDILLQNPILILGGEPSREEHYNQKIFASAPATKLRCLLEKLAPGTSFVYDRALRCAPLDEKDLGNKHVASCRGYLAQVIEKLKPSRIFAFGGHAHEALLDRRPDFKSIRKSYTYTFDSKTPIFMFKDFQIPMTHKFEYPEMEEDIKWALTATPPLPPWDGYMLWLETVEEVKAAIAEAKLQPWFSIDIENAGVFRDIDYRLLCVSISFQDNDWAYVIPEDLLEKEEVKALLRDLILTTPLSAFNSQHECRVLWWWLGMLDWNDNAPVRETKIAIDPMWVRRQEDSRIQKRLDFAAETVGMGGHKEANESALALARAEIRDRVATYEANGCRFENLMLLPSRMKKTIQAACRYLHQTQDFDSIDMFSHGLVPPETEARYCALDTVANGKLATMLYSRIHGTEEDEESQRMRRQWRLFTEPSIKGTAQVEIWGLPTSRQRLLQTHKKMEKIMAKCLEQLRAEGFEGNPGSPDQVRQFLFETKGFKSDVKTDGGELSVGAEVLEALNKEYEKTHGKTSTLLDSFLDYAAAAKIEGTFSKTLAGFITSKGLIHPHLEPGGADTGRYKCSKPNTQQIPAHTEHAKDVKDAFIPESDDEIILQFDFKALELRAAAGLSKDEKYAQLFIDGVDPHLGTASLVWGIDGISPEERDKRRQNAKCYHPETEVLTKTGWKRLKRVSVRDEIAVCDVSESGLITSSFKHPLKVFTAYHPSNKLLHFQGPHTSVSVTPDHGMLVFEKGTVSKVPASEVKTGVMKATSTYEGNSELLPKKVREVISPLDEYQLSSLGQALGIVRSRLFFSKRYKRYIMLFQDVSELAEVRRIFESSGLGFNLEKVREDGWGSGGRVSFPGETTELLAQLLHRGTWEAKPLFLHLPLPLRQGFMDTVWRFTRDHKKLPDKTTRKVVLRDFEDANIFSAVAALSGTAVSSSQRKNAQHKDPKVFYDFQLHTPYIEVSELEVTEEEHHSEVACVVVDTGLILTRYQGKVLVCGNTVNFGVLFGKEEFGLSQDLGVSTEEAKRIKNQILDIYKQLKEYIADRQSFVADNGYTYTQWWDFEVNDWVNIDKRYLSEAGSPIEGMRNKAKRQSVNTPVQGSSALYTKASIWAVTEFIHDSGLPIKIRNTVHDSMDVTTKKSLALYVADEILKIMGSWGCWKVPIEADVELGPSKARLKKLKVLQKFAELVKLDFLDQEIAHVLDLCKPEKFTDEVCAPYRKICEDIGLLEAA